MNETKKTPNYVGGIVGIEGPEGDYYGTYFVRDQHGVILDAQQLGRSGSPTPAIDLRSCKVVPVRNMPSSAESDVLGHHALRMALAGEPENIDPKYQTIYSRAVAHIHRLRMELDAAGKGYHWATEKLKAETLANDELRERNRTLRDERAFFSSHLASEQELAAKQHNEIVSLNDENKLLREMLKQPADSPVPPDVDCCQAPDCCPPPGQFTCAFSEPPKQDHVSVTLHVPTLPLDYEGDIHVHVYP